MDIPRTEQKDPQKVKSVMRTSRDDPAIAEKIRQSSAKFMKKNYQLYKNLENK